MLIGGVTGIIGVVAAVVLTNMPSTHSMTLFIRSLSPQDMSAYAPLNNVPSILASVFVLFHHYTATRSAVLE